MPSIADIRKQFPTLSNKSDYEIADIYAKGEGIDADTAYYELGVAKPNADGFRSGLKRGLAGMVGGVGEIVGDVSGNRGNALTMYAKNVEHRNPSEINSLQDVLDKPGTALSSAVGNATSFLLPGGGLKLGAAGLRAAKAANAARAIDNPLTQAAVAGLPSLGEIGDSQRAQGVVDDPTKYLGALGVGAIENLGGVQRVLGFGGQQARRTAAQEVAGFGNTPWKTALKTTGRMMGQEGLEEVAQTPIEQVAGYRDPTTAQALEETALGGVMGTMGGVIGAGHGVSQGMRHARIQRGIATDMLNPEADYGRRRELGEFNQAFMARAGDTGAQQWFTDFNQGAVADRDASRMGAYRQVYDGQMNDQAAQQMGFPDYDTYLAWEAANAPRGTRIGDLLGMAPEAPLPPGVVPRSTPIQFNPTGATGPVYGPLANATPPSAPAPVANTPDLLGMTPAQRSVAASSPIQFNPTGATGPVYGGLANLSRDEAQPDALGMLPSAARTPAASPIPFNPSPVENTYVGGQLANAGPTPSARPDRFGMLPSEANVPARSPIPFNPAPGDTSPTYGAGATRTQVKTDALGMSTEAYREPAKTPIPFRPAKVEDAPITGPLSGFQAGQASPKATAMKKASKDAQAAEKKAVAPAEKSEQKPAKKSQGAVKLQEQIDALVAADELDANNEVLQAWATGPQKSADVEAVRRSVDKLRTPKAADKILAEKAAEQSLAEKSGADLEQAPNKARAVLESLIADLGKTHPKGAADLSAFIGYATGDETNQAKQAAGRGVSRQAVHANVKKALGALGGVAEARGITADELQTLIRSELETVDENAAEILAATQTSEVDVKDFGGNLTVKDNRKASKKGATKPSAEVDALAAEQAEDSANEDEESTRPAYSTHVDPEEAYRVAYARAFEKQSNEKTAEEAGNAARAKAKRSNALLAKQDAEGRLEEPEAPKPTAEPTYNHSAADYAVAEDSWAYDVEEALRGGLEATPWEELPQALKDRFTQVVKDATSPTLARPNYSAISKARAYYDEEHQDGKSRAEARAEPDAGGPLEDPGSLQVDERGSPGVEEVSQRVAEEAQAETERAAPAEESLTPEAIETAWNDAATPLGLPTFAELTSSQRNELLGASTEAEFNDVANDIAADVQAEAVGASAVAVRENPTTELAPNLDLDALIGAVANVIRGVTQMRTKRRSDGRYDIVAGNTTLATMGNEPRSANQALVPIMREYADALRAEGRTLSRNPAELTRDQFVVANELGNLIPQFDIDSSFGGVSIKDDGTYGIDHDALYDMVQRQAGNDTHAEVTPDDVDFDAAPDAPTTSARRIEPLAGRRTFVRAMVGLRSNLPKSPTLDADLRKNLVAGNVKGALDAIAAGGSSVAARQLAKKISALMAGDVRVEVVEPGKYYPEGVPNILASAYGVAEIDRENKRITIYLRSDVGVNEETVLHEALHAALQSRYDFLEYGATDGKAGAAALAQFNETWKAFQAEVSRATGELPIGVREAARSPDEFITYALTNPETQAWMQSRRYRGQTLWERFKNFVASALGFRSAPNWLDAAMRVSNAVLEGAAQDKADFSASDALAGRAAVSPQLIELADRYGPTAAKAVTDTSNIMRKAGDSMLFLHDLVDKYKGQLQSAGDWYKAVQGSIARKHQLEQDAEQIATRAGRLTVDLNRPGGLNDFIARSTFEQKWGYDATFDGVNGQKVVKADPEMAKAFKALSAEEQQIAKDVFAHGEKMATTKFKLLKDLGLTSNGFLTMGKLVGPYAPLKRFGNYVSVGKSQQLVDLETKRAAQEKAGAKTTEVDKQIQALKADPDHYIVSYHATPGLAREEARGRAGQYAFTDHFEKSARVDQDRKLPQEVFQKIVAAVNAESLPGDVKEAMRNMVEQLYVESLDEHNARTSGLKRANRAGFDPDMMKAFLSHARAEANFLANIEFGPQMNAQFFEMQNQAKDAGGQRSAQDAFNAFGKHYAENLTYRETPWQDRAMALTSAWQLATSVGYHVTNATQGIMVTVPKLAADFGDYAGAWRHMMDGYRTLAATGVKDMDLTKVRDAGLRAALQRASDMGVLDVGMDEDLTQFDVLRTGYAGVDKASSVARKALHLLRQTSRWVETANRVSAATAAYRMAREKGRSVEEAQDYAVKILQSTQGDFSRVGAPLLLKKLPKPMTQYRKYQFMMGALYAKAFSDAFGSADADTKAIGRRMLKFKLAHTAFAAGALGLPLMNLAGLMFAATGDDDEPKDLERSLRDWIGDETLADLLLHGVPAMAGIDMHAKLGDDKVFSITPYTEWDVSSREGFAKTLVGFMGPAAAQGATFADGVGKIQKGDYYKGLEQFMPKGIKDGMAAFRMANEGYTLTNGDVLVGPEDISGFSLAASALGMPSTEVKRIQWLRGQQYEASQFFTDRTRAIQREYAAAHKSGDDDALADLQDQWLALQDGKDKVRPYFNDSPDALRRQPLSTLLKYPGKVAERERKLQATVPE